MQTREYTITTTRERQRLGLPSELLKTLGVKRGDVLQAQARSGGVLLKPKRTQYARDELTPRQRVLMDARLARSIRDIKEGRSYGPFDSVEAFLKSLHRQSAREHRRRSR